jgi:hypothetical protein
MRSSALRAVGVAAVLSLCLLIAGAGVAGAGKSTKVKSNVKIRSGGPTAFKGKVGSKRTRCRKGRKVILFRFEDSVYGESGSKEKLGSDRTNKKGRWVVKPPSGGSFSAGEYQAKVTVKKIRSKGSAATSAGSRTKCLADRARGKF